MNPSLKTKPIIDPAEVQRLITMRETQKAMKDRLELMDEAIKAAEAQIIAAIDGGADPRIMGVEIAVQEVSRRYPTWKEHFIARLGKSQADAVMEATTPTVYRRLVIR